jgi:hypothetical protein
VITVFDPEFKAVIEDTDLFGVREIKCTFFLGKDQISDEGIGDIGRLDICLAKNILPIRPTAEGIRPLEVIIRPSHNEHEAYQSLPLVPSMIKFFERCLDVFCTLSSQKNGKSDTTSKTI